MTTFDSGAKRVEQDIPRYADIPPCALRRLALIFSEGADKYGIDNWKNGLPWPSTYNHLMEHLQKYNEGDRTEDHLAKACWGLVVQIYFDEQSD